MIAVPPSKEARLKTMYLLSHRIPFKFDGHTITYESRDEIEGLEFDEGTKPTGKIVYDVDLGRKAFEVIKKNGEKALIIYLERRR